MVEEKGKQTAEEKQRRKPWALREFGGKTLWDWLQLLVVPIVLSLITVAFAWQQSNHQQEIEEKRAESDRQIEEQRAEDAALQAYLDQMSQLMLERDLRSSKEDNEVRILARARTRTVLARLNSHRKGSVVRFLYEADLINKKHPVVSLADVRLSGADLSGAKLIGADLSGGADLSDANLIGTNLRNADLVHTILSGANLNGADLSGADLSGATLIGTDLIGGARLSYADLSDATLIDADLSDTYLNRADLSGANLFGAKLGVSEEELKKQAKTLEGATMPKGSIHN